MSQTVNLPAVQETRVQSLGQEDSLEKGMVTHSSILAWRIPWIEESGRLQSMGSQKAGHEWATNTFIFTFLCQEWEDGMGEDNWTSGGKKGDFRILQPVGISKTSSLVSLRPRGSGWFSGAHPESPEQNWDYNLGDLVCFEKYYTIQKDRLVVKNPPANAGDIRDAGLIPRSGRSPAGEHGNPLQYSHLENPIDRGAR